MESGGVVAARVSGEGGGLRKERDFICSTNYE